MELSCNWLAVSLSEPRSRPGLVGKWMSAAPDQKKNQTTSSLPEPGERGGLSELICPPLNVCNTHPPPHSPLPKEEEDGLGGKWGAFASKWSVFSPVSASPVCLWWLGFELKISTNTSGLLSVLCRLTFLPAVSVYEGSQQPPLRSRRTFAPWLCRLFVFFLRLRSGCKRIQSWRGGADAPSTRSITPDSRGAMILTRPWNYLFMFSGSVFAALRPVSPQLPPPLLFNVQDSASISRQNISELFTRVWIIQGESAHDRGTNLPLW